MNDDFNQNTQNTEPNSFPRLNPWLSIWLKPTATMEQMVDNTENWLIWLLAIVGGIVNALSRISDKQEMMAQPIESILSTVIIGGAISGLLGLALGSGLMKWTGGWIGGSGSYDRIKTAVAWANVPQVVLMVINFTMLIIMKNNYFLPMNLIQLIYPLGFYILYWGYILLNMILSIWSVIMLIKGLAVAQRFSGGKALLNILLTGLVVIVPLFLVIFLFVH